MFLRASDAVSTMVLNGYNNFKYIFYKTFKI